MYLSIQSFSCSFIHLLIFVFINLFFFLFIYLSVYLYMYLLIYSLINLFIYTSIHLFNLSLSYIQIFEAYFCWFLFNVLLPIGSRSVIVEMSFWCVLTVTLRSAAPNGTSQKHVYRQRYGQNLHYNILILTGFTAFPGMVSNIEPDVIHKPWYMAQGENIGATGTCMVLRLPWAHSLIAMPWYKMQSNMNDFIKILCEIQLPRRMDLQD